MKKSISLEQAGRRQPGSVSTVKSAPRAVAREKVAKPAPPQRKESVRLLEEHYSNSEAHAIRFGHFDPAAREVFLAGSFNDWQPRAQPLQKQSDGQWTTEVLLKPGEYEYRLVVDGRWQDDPLAPRFIANPFGSLNSVMKVPATHP